MKGATWCTLVGAVVVVLAVMCQGHQEYGGYYAGGYGGYPAGGAGGYEGDSDAVLMESVKALTFTKGAYTTGRRSAPMQQLTCRKSPGSMYEPSTVQCQNVGSDGSGIQWKCEADLDTSVKFGPLSVSCEGYSYPDDPYILKGSCALEYTLESTSGASHYGQYGQYNYYDTNNSHKGSGSIWWLFILALICAVVYIGYTNSRRAAVGGAAPGGYRGGPDGGYGPGHGGYGDGYSGAPPPGSCPPHNYPSTSTGRPGFWTGLMAGGLLSSLMRRPSYRTASWGGSSYSSPTHFGGGGGGGSRMASGFGGTTRR
ncbi:store-operated calcium entry-associated regulatory factor [Pelomyxa schiedti]|nr:store-operated calcium entry-associated regulatory factor [Pelomyxa schiedti]